MARTQAQDKWDAEHMTYQTIKVKRDELDRFKAACAENGDTVNGVLRQAMKRYVDGSTEAEKRPSEGESTA